MNETFTTQSMNFVNALETHVDPRTGQFVVSLPITKVIGNHQLGPEFPLGLSYSPLNHNNNGFGNGFSLSVTQFNNKTNRLALSNEETYRVAPGSDTVRNQKLDNFRFVYTNGIGDTEGYTVFWKDGKQEQLTSIGNDSFVTTTITSPLGRKMNLLWDWNGQTPLLARITDEQTTLCEVSYENDVTMTIWPDTNETYEMTFVITNGEQLNTVSRKISDTETLSWFFSYELEENTQNRLLTEVHYPTGKFDRVRYNKVQGLQFPEKSGIKSRLPAVVSHTSNPGGGQPETITYYEYTIQNFLGYNGNFGDWSADRDYIYTTLTDYEYGSKEIVSDGDTNITIVRAYNNYHLQTREETTHQNYVYRVDFSYYAEKWAFIESQPKQFQLPREKKEAWTDEKGNSRMQSTLTEFDSNGNPVRQVSPDGTETITTWYPAEGEEGCPAEPNSFIRFMKKQVVTPRKTEFDAPIMTIEFKYKILGEEKNHVVQDEVSDYADGVLIHRRNFTYNSSQDKTEYGRIISIVDSQYEEGESSDPFVNRQDFMTIVKNGVLNQKSTFTGHDGILTSSVRMQSALSGLLFSETDIQGVTIAYTCDPLGRPLTRNFASGTDYENITTWTYTIEDRPHTQVWVTTQSDNSGNQLQLIFDGAGRNICTKRLDADRSQQWFEVSSRTYNVFGDVCEETTSDLRTDTFDQYSLKTTFSRDGWGLLSTQAFSSGTKKLLKTNPVSLTRSVCMEGAKNDKNIRGGMLSTTFGQNSHLPQVESSLSAIGTEMGRRTYEWDGLGRLRQERDELDHVNKRTYDVYGRVLTQVLSDGTVVTRTYAPHLTGEQVSSIKVTGRDAKGQTKTWIMGTQQFDSLGRVKKRICGGRVSSFKYEGASPVPSVIALPSGEKVTYTYIPELGNAVSSLTAQEITQNFSYDKKTGKLLMAVEGDAKINNIWSRSGLLTEENFSYGERSQTSVSTHTLNGKPVSYTDITGKKMQYIMDSLGRIIRITEETLSVDLTYDPLGRLSERKVCDRPSSSSLTTTLTHDDFGRELTRTIKNNHGMVLNISQTWQKNGLLSARATENNGVKLREEEFKYDLRNRLVDYNASGSHLPVDSYGCSMTRQTYCYDALNNITAVKTVLVDGTSDSATYLYKNDNDPTQLTTVTHTHEKYPTTVSLSYDVEGRMISDEAGRTLTYDVTGRLIGVSCSNGQSGAYTYDALGRLITRNVDNTNTHEFYYRGSELVNEITSSQKKGIRLLKLGHASFGLSDDSGLTLTTADHNDSLLWSADTSDTSKEGQLHIWSPYGSGKSDGRLPGFNGERIDPVNGTYHLGNGYRAYNPVLMRFNCPDSLSPFGAGGINPYTYCAGDPVNHTDPSGHLSWEGIFGIVVGAVGLGLAAFTAGASIAAAGGVMAAISTASATSLVIGGLGVVSDLTAIASGVLEDTHPEVSSILGYISLATGLPGLVKEFPKAMKQFKSLKVLTNTNALKGFLSASNLGAHLGRSRTITQLTKSVVDKIKNVKYVVDVIMTGYGTEEIARDLFNSKDDKQTITMSKAQGNRLDAHWQVSKDVTGEEYPHIIGEQKSHGESFYSSDHLKHASIQVKVVDINYVSFEQYAAHITNEHQGIFEYCYGRNDRVYRCLLYLNLKT